MKQTRDKFRILVRTRERSQNVSKNVLKIDFETFIFRHGAWLTMNNVDLHLIKGRPAVHADDDLIVGHIAITVSGEKMDHLRERLTSMGVKFRKNVVFKAMLFFLCFCVAFCVP